MLLYRSSEDIGSLPSFLSPTHKSKWSVCMHIFTFSIFLYFWKLLIWLKCLCYGSTIYVAAFFFFDCCWSFHINYIVSQLNVNSWLFFSVSSITFFSQAHSNQFCHPWFIFWFIVFFYKESLRNFLNLKKITQSVSLRPSNLIFFFEKTIIVRLYIFFRGTGLLFWVYVVSQKKLCQPSRENNHSLFFLFPSSPNDFMLIFYHNQNQSANPTTLFFFQLRVHYIVESNDNQLMLL